MYKIMPNSKMLIKRKQVKLTKYIQIGECSEKTKYVNFFFNINTFFISKTKSTLITYVALTKPDSTYTSLSYSHDK